MSTSINFAFHSLASCYLCALIGTSLELFLDTITHHFTKLSLPFCALAGSLLLFPALSHADTTYYRHTFFDNSITHDSYFYSYGKPSAPSRVENINGKLPVESKIFYTPPNALRLSWQSARDGGWDAGVRVVN